ncbi:hypothetical protein ACO2Q3_12535 [Caulobacter sp. KR2-114]|uniref:hypothetical protein n=1 Tax=Caulobacter sp. KR2-114 TaxID=3400912 RepID=UPI003C0526D5
MSNREKNLPFQEALAQLRKRLARSLPGTQPSSLPARPAPIAPTAPPSPPAPTKAANASHAPSPLPVAANDEQPVADLKGRAALAYVHSKIFEQAMQPALTSETLTPEAVGAISATVKAGAARIAMEGAPDEGGYVVGLDFGTSSTKVVVRQPGAGDPSYALTVPEGLRAEPGAAGAHLWATRVWYSSSSGRFALTSFGDAEPITGFKTGLIPRPDAGQIHTRGHRMAAHGVTYAQAATAFLALMIAYVVGDHDNDAPAGIRRADYFSRFHVGLPVSCKDEAGCVEEMHGILAAAFRLASQADQLDLDAVREALRDADKAEAAGADTPFVLYEELAAVIAGYKVSPDHRAGAHVIVDVGAATLDVATFYLPAGDENVQVLMSSVDTLGGEALALARRNGVPDPTFRAACAQHTRRVLSYTFLRKDSRFFPLNGIPKPLLFVGGGRLTDVHSELYNNYPQGLEAPLVTPKPQRGLKYTAGADFARLVLAWGLSQGEEMLPTLTPPSQIEDEVRRHRDYTASFVDKDMC